MKPVSIIFLIISVVLIIIGMLTCSFAMVQARIQGVQLFDTKNSDGEFENVFDFSADDIGKIKIDVADADVKIICGAEHNKIEIRNFKSTDYVCQIENKALVMENGLNILSLTDLAQGEIRFKGFRYYVKDFLGNEIFGSKSVNVYISDTYDIKAIDVKTTNGNITLEGSEFDADIILGVENGDVTASNIVTNSSFDVTVTKNGNVTLSDVSCAMSEIKCENGSVKGELTADELVINSEKDVQIACTKDLEEYNYDVVADNGKINIMGINLNSSHKAYNPKFSKRMQIITVNGDVKISVAQNKSAE